MTTGLFFDALRRSCLTGLLVGTIGPLFAAQEPSDSSDSKPNRLAAEKSPYLRQHALNPIDWYPWGPEAFEKARRENKPIFLSVGYSTCHWCHVMARESFSDGETARLLNDSFVSIKVDREERPDIDRVYMMFVQAFTGNGGWPMSVWLTPDLKPFFGGTYFPPENRGGLPGFKTVLRRVAATWQEQPDKVVEQSDRMLQMLADETKQVASSETLPIAELREKGFESAVASFDKVHGGFEQAPKFPSPVMLEFLLDVHATTTDREKSAEARAMLLKTLRGIVAGGIHDQLGGGFHRYSVDEKWHVPHFEKMLYDQAQLASVCLSAWQVSRDPTLKTAAVDTLRYIADRLTDADGGFRTAEDADSVTVAEPSEHREGAFYVWTAGEIEAVLGEERAEVFEFVFGVRAGGNVAQDDQGEFGGQNILFREHTVAEAAAKYRRSDVDIQQTIDESSQRLFAARERRPRPMRDDKIVTAWNGLAISAYARAAQILSEPAYAATAERAAAFLQTKLFDAASGQLSHSYLAGVRDGRGFAEDYSFVIQGLLDVYEATFATRWLEWAIHLQEKQIELFWDPVAGGFFANVADDPSVVLRLKEDNEGAEPSANSIAVRNLARLSAMLHREDWRDLAAQTAGAFARQLDQSPTAMPQMLASIGWLENSPKQVLIHGALASADTQRLVEKVRERFLPRGVIMLIDAESRAFFDAQVPMVAGLPDGQDGPATAYVCENFVCQLPTTEPAVLEKLLQSGTVAGPASAMPANN